MIDKDEHYSENDSSHNDINNEDDFFNELEAPEGEKSNYTTLDIVVDPGQDLLRLDLFLLDRLPNMSRSKIQEGIKTENVFVNRKQVKSNYKVRPGDVITVLQPKKEYEIEVLPEDIPINIVYEDDDVAIVHKEAGMVVHPGYNNWTGTLVNALAFRFENLPTAHNGEEKPGLVHRIDKETSGLLVVAKNNWAMSFLAKQFFEHSIERTYYALVWGEVKDDEGTIVGNIGRSYSDRRKRQVFAAEDGYGKHAVTHYKVLKRMRYVTLVQCNLETGRTHQIRVHFQHLGHTLFNDKLYGGDRILKGEKFSKYKAFVENCFKEMPRQALHAKSLGFRHPKTKEWMQFDTELPSDFAEVIKRWENYVQHH